MNVLKSTHICTYWSPFFVWTRSAPKMYHYFWPKFVRQLSLTTSVYGIPAVSARINEPGRISLVANPSPWNKRNYNILTICLTLYTLVILVGQFQIFRVNHGNQSVPIVAFGYTFVFVAFAHNRLRFRSGQKIADLVGLMNTVAEYERKYLGKQIIGVFINVCIGVLKFKI